MLCEGPKNSQKCMVLENLLNDDPLCATPQLDKEFIYIKQGLAKSKIYNCKV